MRLLTYKVHILHFFLKTDAKFFITKTANIKPKLVIKECRLFMMACLLQPESLIKINQRLASSNGTIQLPFLADITKSYTVATGRLQDTIDIT